MPMYLRSVIYEIPQGWFINIFSVLPLYVSQGDPGLPGLDGITVSYICVEISMFSQQLLIVPFHSSFQCLKVFVDLLKENPEGWGKMGHTVDIFQMRKYLEDGLPTSKLHSRQVFKHQARKLHTPWYKILHLIQQAFTKCFLCWECWE